MFSPLYLTVSSKLFRNLCFFNRKIQPADCCGAESTNAVNALLLSIRHFYFNAIALTFAVCDVQKNAASRFNPARESCSINHYAV